VEADLKAFKRLSDLKGKIDIVFNLAEGMAGDAREAQTPLFCEMLNLPYTHSGPTTQALTLNKYFTCLALSGAGFNVAKSLLVIEKKDLDKFKLSFPVIVKPNQEGSSKGIFDANVVDNHADLVKRVEYVSEGFTKPVLLEEYIDGREFTVSTLGNDPVRVLPIIEQKFDFLPKGMKKIASFELKWIFEEQPENIPKAYGCPADITKAEKELIESTTVRVTQILNIKDACRMDYRLTPEGKLYFLEVNPRPGINPDPKGMSYYVMSAKVGGLEYREMIGQILDSAVKRLNLV
jgi:D-alanine-D-alanine ligase